MKWSDIIGKAKPMTKARRAHTAAIAQEKEERRRQTQARLDAALTASRSATKPPLSPYKKKKHRKS